MYSLVTKIWELDEEGNKKGDAYIWNKDYENSVEALYDFGNVYGKYEVIDIIENFNVKRDGSLFTSYTNSLEGYPTYLVEKEMKGF